jgi:RHS repeat-associated protein
MTAPTGGRFTYQYDGAGRITRLVNPEGDRTTFAYDADSRRTVKKLANGTRASFTYDAASNLTTLANLLPDGTYISKYDYKYDATGNRYAVAEADGSRVTWLYDNLYQLTGENRTGTTPFRNTFTYDPLGNRLAKTESDVRTTYAYDAANQLKYALDVSGRTTYTFDAAGNQQRVVDPSGARTTTVWNYENQPTLYKLPDATRVTMAYHPDLLRVQKDTSAGTTKFIWDDQNYLAEADGPNVVTTVYTNEPERYGRLVSSRRSVDSLYEHSDALLARRALSSVAASQVQSNTVSAFGQLLATSGRATPTGAFCAAVGYQFDTQLLQYYVRRRAYHQSLGRWTSSDPRGFADDDNLYCYSHNCPASLNDPSGLSSREDIPNKLIYTCNCGWIDWTHATRNVALDVIDQVRGRRGRKSENYNGFMVSSRMMMGPKWFRVGPDFSDFFVQFGLGEVQEEEVALAIYNQVSLDFERFQKDTWIYFPANSSGFSIEDLPSDLIGFYRALRGYTKEQILKFCVPLDSVESGRAWDESGGLRPWFDYTSIKMKGGLPELWQNGQYWRWFDIASSDFSHNLLGRQLAYSPTADCACRAKGASRIWPEQLRSVAQAPKGRLWRDWRLVWLSPVDQKRSVKRDWDEAFWFEPVEVTDLQ